MNAGTIAAAVSLLTTVLVASPLARAQDHRHHDHGAMQPAAATPATTAGDTGPDAPAPVTPVAEPTAADRAAAFPDLSGGMEHAPAENGFVLVDQLEFWDADSGTGLTWLAEAWFGSDINRLWLRTAGDRVDSVTEGAELEILYGRSFVAWWDVVAGIKHDFKPGASRNWAALGIEGLMPGQFEASVMTYLADGGHFAASVEIKYDLLITNRLILQPLVASSYFGKSDLEYGIASGIQDFEAALRLRYEFSRRFAPYVGVVYSRALGNTADQLAAAGEDKSDTTVVAGIRAWL